MMTAAELADRIVEAVNQCGDATHGSLIHRHGLSNEVRGDLEMAGQRSNIVLAVGTSTLFVDAFNLLKNEEPKRVQVGVTEMMVALIDGCPFCAAYPVASCPPKNGYKKPHFAPLIFRRLGEKPCQ